MAVDKKTLFIKISRDIEDNFLWHPIGRDRFDSRSAWIDLILQANVSDKPWNDGRRKIIVKRGQFVTSIRKLADRWNWNNSKVEDFLKMLVEEQMILKESNKNYTLLTIVNYGMYQDKADTNRNAKWNANENTNRNVKWNQLKNIKNEKNEKNSVAPSADSADEDEERFRGLSDDEITRILNSEGWVDDEYDE